MKMMDKIVKTRTEHLCSQCGEMISAGSAVRLHESRMPEYEYNEAPDGREWKKQVGIWFNRAYYHTFSCLDENGELMTVKNDQK